MRLFILGVLTIALASRTSFATPVKVVAHRDEKVVARARFASGTPTGSLPKMLKGV